MNRYPEWCVRKNDAVRFLRCDSNTICDSFLDDLTQRMPSLFNKQFKFTTQALYWQNSLPAADSGNKSFLTKQPQSIHHKQTKVFSGDRPNSTSSLEEGFRYDKPEDVYREQQTCTATDDGNKVSQVQTYSSIKKQISSKPSEQQMHLQCNSKNVNSISRSNKLSANCFKKTSTYRNSSCPTKEVEGSKNPSPVSMGCLLYTSPSPRDS